MKEKLWLEPHPGIYPGHCTYPWLCPVSGPYFGDGLYFSVGPFPGPVQGLLVLFLYYCGPGLNPSPGPYSGFHLVPGLYHSYSRSYYAAYSRAYNRLVTKF